MSHTEVAAEPIPIRRIIGFTAMVFGMFMAILDIQIVSASIAEIRAGLSASASEVAWVQTAYLIAEVVMIPLSGLLSRVFSTRVLFTVSAAGFTLMSFMCATAGSIEEMIIWRALQGFIGGAMIPTVFSAAFTIFPRNKQHIVSPIIGLVATLAPTIGPTVGGYLTEMFSWHWLFLVNIVPGILVSIAAWTLIDFDKADHGLMKYFDWLGLAAMALMLGTVEYFLEEGPAKGWLDDPIILWCGLVAVFSAAYFFWRTFSVSQPIVNLSAFADRNFATGSFFSFTLGIGLYGLTYLYPVYLARVQGYSALMIGETMFVTGICMFLTAPIAGRLMQKVDPRFMMAAGFGGFAVGTWMASYINAEWEFYELLVPQMLRGCSLMICMVPITNIALGTLPPDRIKNASGLFNLTRNLGGAVGLALINTILNSRTDLHFARLRDSVNWASPAAEEAIAGLTQRLAPSLGSDAPLAAIKQLSGLVRREATVMAIADVFYLLTFLFLAIVVMVPLMRRPKPAPGTGGGH